MSIEETMRTLLENTQAAYLTCCQTLSSVKDLRMGEGFRDGLLLFQPTLAKALCELDREDRNLNQSRDELVKQKSKLSKENFLRDIKRLGKFQDIIGEAAQLGRILGDAFAWLFYHNEERLLFKHLEHQSVTEVPTGVGLAGELAFINNVQVVDGHFVLYHGITTILRHGDVSLIDLDTFKLTALGELKSRNSESGIEVVAHFVNPKGRPLPPTFRNCPKLNRPDAALPPKMEERFRRQLQGMAGALKPNGTSVRIYCLLGSLRNAIRPGNSA